jgi:hypothetical protein
MSDVPFRLVSSNFTRPNDTTAYASGDLVANNTTAGSVTPLSWDVHRSPSGSFRVNRVKVKKSGAVVTNASFRLHLYSTAPTVANGDNGAWSSSEAGYLGFIDVVVDKAFTDGSAGHGAPVYTNVCQLDAQAARHERHDHVEEDLRAPRGARRLHPGRAGSLHGLLEIEPQ